MSNSVLEYVREREPRFRDVPDDRLTLYIGERHPDFLRREDFADVFQARQAQEANTKATEKEATTEARLGRYGEAVGERVGEMLESGQAIGRAIGEPVIQGFKDAGQFALREGKELLGAVANAGEESRKRREMLMSTNWPVALQSMLAAEMGPARLLLQGAGKVLQKTSELVGEDAKNILGTTMLDPVGPVSQGLQGAAASAPQLGVGMLLTSIGVPPSIAFGVSAGAQTLAETDDPAQAAVATAKMAALPPVHAGARALTATGVRAAVERGVFPATATGAQKAIEVVGGQVGLQAFMEAMNLPEYARMSPEEREAAIKRNLVANSAFAMLDVPHLRGDGPSEAMAGLSPQARAALMVKELVEDRGMVDWLRERADEEADRVWGFKTQPPAEFTVQGSDRPRDVAWEPFSGTAAETKPETEPEAQTPPPAETKPEERPAEETKPVEPKAETKPPEEKPKEPEQLDDDAPSPVGSVEMGYAIRGGKNWTPQQRIDHAEKAIRELEAERASMVGEERQNNRARRNEISRQRFAWDQEIKAAKDALAKESKEETKAETKPAEEEPITESHAELDESYGKAQKEIDSIEDRLEKEGANVIHLYNPDDPKSAILKGYEDWQPMPPDLVAAYGRRDAFGAKMLRSSRAGIKKAIEDTGLKLPGGTINRILQYYAIHPSDNEAIHQVHAFQHTKNAITRDLKKQLEDLGIILKVARNESIDDVTDLDSKTYRDAGTLLEAVADYFGVKPRRPTYGTEPEGATKEKPVGIDEGGVIDVESKPAEKPKAEAKPEPKTEAKPEPKPEPKPESKGQKPLTPDDVAEWLNVSPSTATRERERLKEANRVEAGLRKKLEEVQNERKKIDQRVLKTTGPRYARGAVKKSASKSDLAARKNLLEQEHQLDQEIGRIRRESEEDRIAVERADHAKIVNDPTKPLWHRLRRRRAMMPLDTPKETVQTAFEAEQEAVKDEIRKRYPDATPLEVVALSRAFDTYPSGWDVDRAFKNDPGLSLEKLRADEAKLAADKAARDKANLEKAAETAEAQAEAERKAKIRAEDEAKLQQLIKEAQEIAASAPKAGSEEAKRTGLTPTKVKNELIDRVEKALKDAPDIEGEEGKPLRVVIAVPGDGVFVLSNTKKVLGELRKRAKSMETATSPAEPGKPGAIKVPKLGAADPKDLRKPLKPFVSTEVGRESLHEVWSMGSQAAATNGRVAVWLFANKEKSTPLQGSNQFPIKQLGELWARTRESNVVGPFPVKSEDLWRAARLAKRLEADRDGNHFVELYAGPDGLYAEVNAPGGDFASYGRKGEKKYLGRFDATYLEDVAELHRKLGHDQLSLGRADDTKNPMLFTRQAMHIKEPVEMKALIMGTAPAKAKGEAKTEAKGEAKDETVEEGYPARGEGEDVPRTEPKVAPEEDLFSDAEERAAQAAQSENYPSGNLGSGPPDPADNPFFSIFPMELPEAVQFARELNQGKHPKLMEKLGNGVLGVFRHNDATGFAEIQMRRDLFDLPPGERARLRAEAKAFAEAMGGTDAQKAAAAKARYDQLKMIEFRKNPEMALKVLWHEIGHLVDWLPDHKVQGRGNLFGHVAALHDFMESTLPEVPGLPNKPITPAEKAALRAEAERQMKAELGPIIEIVRKIMVEEPQWEIRGVTPDDIRNIFGNTARTDNPQLYLWFAEQPAAVKKEIVKAAMRGVVDPRLAALGSRVNVGSKMVEREVREKSGREPTPEEIQERFRKLFEAEVAARRLVELSKVKSELMPLIAWWRGTAQMEQYFRTGTEMYAEAFSIWMNNPAAMAKRAPTYFKLLMNYLENRPQVSALYHQIQTEIRTGSLPANRARALRESWAKDDAQSLARLAQKAQVKAGEWLDNVLYHSDRRFGPIYRVARGTKNEPAVREALGNMLYRAAEHERFLGLVNRVVARRLGQSNLEWDDLAEFLFHQHVINSRFRRDPATKELLMLGNPRGWAPKNSLERLQQMKLQLGPQRWAELVDSQKDMRQIYEQEVVSLLERVQMYGPELMAAIKERVFYAPFQVQRGVVKDGIEALLQDAYGPEVSGKIYKQTGNLGDIKNPATALVMKGTSLQSAAYRNEARRQTVLAMLEQEPEFIKKADVGLKGIPVIRENSEVGTIVFLRDGKAHAFYVPRDIADGVNGGPPLRSVAVTGMMVAARGVKALLTQLNAGWWPFAAVKDAAAWNIQLPGAHPIDYLRHIVPALGSAMKYNFKGESGRIEEALGRKMLISRADYLYRDQDQVSNEFDRRLIQVGLEPAFWKGQLSLGQRFNRAWERYKGFGQALERAHKIAGMTYLDEAHPTMPEWKKAEIVRERAGSPDFLQRGHMSPQVELLGMFLNPWKEGIRSMLKAGKENPGTFTAKVAAGLLMPSIMQSLLSSGIAGNDLKRMYRSISDYDLSNYFVVPLGWHDKKKTKATYVRIPLPDSFRLMHSIVWHGLTGRDRGLGSVVAGNIPGVSPLLTTGAMWVSYASGQNPYDGFTGREVLDPDVFTLGGTPAQVALLKETWNRLGGAMIHRFKTRPVDSSNQSQLEEALALPGVSNIVGRWIKVSGSGWGDEARRAAKPVAKEEAARRVAVRQMAQDLIDKKPLTQAQKALHHDPKAQRYLLEILARHHEAKKGLPSQAIERLPSKAQKGAARRNQILQER